MFLVLLAGACGYFLLGFDEVRGDLAPSRLESAFMTRAVHASVRREAPEITNPFPPTDENLTAGGKIYLNQCAGCHGTPGKEAKSPGPLNPDAPHLPAAGTEYTEAQIFWVAKHGVRHSGMFANGMWDSDETLWKAASFIKRIRSLPPGVSAAITEKKAE
jgi:mono/diheme cytochrome c family protein